MNTPKTPRSRKAHASNIFDEVDLDFLFDTGYNDINHWYQNHKRISATIEIGTN